MNVFEKVVLIYFFRYDLAVKNIEFRSFRFLKFLYCFQCLFVFPVCHILMRIYNYFFFHEEQVEDNTWMHLDMEYLFQYSTQQFKGKRREQAGYRVEHEQRNSISTSSHVLFVYHSQGWQSGRAGMWPRWRHATGGLGGQWNSPMLITKRSLRKNLQLPGQVEVYRFSLDDRTIEVTKWFVISLTN